MRVLVTGGRDFSDRLLVERTLNSIHLNQEITVLIHGAARGADELAGTWAYENHIIESVFPANWSKYGKSAGPIRNKQMLLEGMPDLVVAFPGGRGTANMVQQARNAGIPVMER
jgi:hypothetical protein